MILYPITVSLLYGFRIVPRTLILVDTRSMLPKHSFYNSSVICIMCNASLIELHVRQNMCICTGVCND